MESEVPWEALLEAERTTRASAAEAASLPADEAAMRLRRWWAEVSRLLRRHADNLQHGVPETASAFEAVRIVGQLADHLARGHVPLPIAYVAGPGRVPPGLSERRDIAFAVAYMQAAKQGLNHRGCEVVVQDSRPAHTIAEAFGVNARTVSRWRSAGDLTELAQSHFDSNTLPILMRVAGERYRSAGRSTAAIKSRG